MDAILHAAVRTLRAAGITDGVVLTEEFRHGSVVVVKHPGDAVERWYEDKTLVAGVSVVNDVGIPFKIRDMPADVLLGWVNPGSRTFRWAFRNEQALPVPLRAPFDLFDVCMDLMNNVPLSAMPVVLTVGDITLRDKVMKSPEPWPRMVDIFDDVLAAERRANFWSVTYEEFIRRTWHPSRMCDWCLDLHERAEVLQIPP
jgi:hypothetical protein